MHNNHQYYVYLFCAVQVGMRHYHLTKNQYHVPILNLDKLWNLVGDAVQAKAASEKGKAAVIDITKYGFSKVSGRTTSYWRGAQ